MFYWHWFLKIVRRSVGTAMIVHYNRETAYGTVLNLIDMNYS